MRLIGTMSGTSLDGVDAAVLETDGRAVLGFGAVLFRPYTARERACLRRALGHWPGTPEADAAAQVVETAHAEAVAHLRDRLRGATVDAVALHGQTLAHAPAGRGTHQAGDGARLARALGLPVVWDFRSADVAAGGQGAPLAPAYHFALARHLGATEPVAFLNLGGVGNLTWADPRAADVAAPGALVAFDTGPANAPIDDLVRARRALPRDEGGAIAAAGRPDASLLARLAGHSYLATAPPKSLDRDDFADLARAVAPLAVEDAAATLTEAVALTVARGLALLPGRPARLLVTGGGRHNGEMMRRIAAACALPVVPVEAVGLDGDMLEAQAFAHLGARVLAGLPVSFPGTTGVPRPLAGGRVSLPA